MDWTPMIGRPRPVEQDALRVLTVVHQLGEEPEASATRWRIDTESQLQHLDHLVRHPIDLAYVLIDQVRSRRSDLGARRADLADRTRRMLGAPPRGRYRPTLLRPFDPGCWERWDDALALLGCRGLLRVEALPAGGRAAGERDRVAGDRVTSDRVTSDLRYRLTAAGDRWLRESVYPSAESLAPTRERCALLRAVLPENLVRPGRRGALGAYLRDVARRLDGYRHDEQLRLEDDLLGRLFQSTFAKPL